MLHFASDDIGAFFPLCSSNGRNEVFLAITIISTVGASIALKFSI